MNVNIIYSKMDGSPHSIDLTVTKENIDRVIANVKCARALESFGLANHVSVYATIGKHVYTNVKKA